MFASKMKLAWLLVLPLSIGFVFVSTQNAAAFSGPGYYSGQTTCSTNWQWVQTCNGTTSGSISASQNNVVVGGITGVGVGSPKSAFYDWLVGKAGTAGGQFILNTMIGTTDTNVLKSRLVDNPNVTMTYVVGGQPRNYGNISLRGKRQDNGAADYFFVGNYWPTPKNLLVFSIGGSVVYVIEIGCANPVGGLPGLPAVTPIGSYDAATCTTVWGWAFDPDKTSNSIRVDVQVDGDTKIWRATDAPRNDVNIAYGISGIHGFQDDISLWVSDGGIHTVEPFAIDIDASGNFTGRIVSLGRRAVGPCITYTLTPSVNVTLPIAVAGASVGVTYAVQNTQSAGSQSGSTNWGLREVTIPAGTAIPPLFMAYKDGSSGCPYFMSFGGGITCNEISTPATTGATNAQVFPGSPGTTTTTLNTTMLNSPSPANINAFNTITVPGGAAPGAHICRVLSVLPRDQGPLMLGPTLNNRDSAVSCVLVASNPYTALVGASSWAGGGTVSPFGGAAGFKGTSSASFGSFDEYGLFATGTVSGFGSGGEYYTGASSGMNPGTRLTFANTPSLGSYTTSHAISDLVARYATSVNTPGVLFGANGHVSASGVYVDTTAGTIYLNGDTGAWSIPVGVHAVIYVPNKTLIIAGDMTYATGGVTSFGQLASLVVVAKNVQINGSVQQVAGWFYATDQFVSCAEGPTTAGASAAISTVGACSKRLTVNGSVSVANQAANSLVLNRSFGGQGAGQAAEIIHMRPEVFLTPYEVGNNPANMLLTTVQETELPARY